MPTVIVQDVPVDVYERLRQRADDERRSVGDELLALAAQALQREDRVAPRLPEFVASKEVPAPFDLPRSSLPVSTTAYAGEPRLPDPVCLERE